MTARRTCAMALALVMCPTAICGAAERWTETTTAHFTVVCDAGVKRAQAIAWEFEQVRAVTARLWPWARVDTDRPVLVIAVNGESAMKTLAPGFWEKKGGLRPASVFVSGADRHYILVRSDVDPRESENVNPYINAYWSYAALIVRSSLPRDLPLWFFRGLASVMSNTIVRDKDVELGRPIPWHLERLRDVGRMRLRDLLRVGPDDPTYVQAQTFATYEAGCWALVHYLMFADNTAHQQQLNDFARRIGEGQPSASAEQALGNLDDLERNYSFYIGRVAFAFARFPVDVDITRESFVTRTLSPAETTATRAAFYAASSRPLEARVAAAEARKLDAKDPASYVAEAISYDEDATREQARAAFERAVALGSKNFYPYYRLAALKWRKDADQALLAELESLLGQAANLNTTNADTYRFLAETKHQLQKDEQALGIARRAVTLEPAASDHRLTVARILWSLHKNAEALEEANRGLARSRTAQERAEAQELIDFFKAHQE